MEVVIKDDFPYSVNNPFRKTSNATPIYNCIAWAAGDSSKWYEPDPLGMYFWPESVPRMYSIGAYISLYEQLGFIECNNGSVEKQFEKIALFATGNQPTHAAKQLINGDWSSKLGINIDVSHTLSSMEGGIYGTVVQFLKRKRINDLAF